MNGPLLVIRADASHNGGTGHIMRTLAIAQEWIRRDGRCTYLCASLPQKMHARLLNEGCEVILLNQQPATPEDASETSTHLAKLRPHWLLIDSYPLNPTYQKQLSLPKRTKVASISDFGPDDFYLPDLIIHANIKATADYSSLSHNPPILAGSKFILLRKELLRKQLNPITTNAQNLLITMGGSDPKEASAALCQHLINSKTIEQLNLRVILGPAYPDAGQMHSINHPNIEIIQTPLSMSQQYQWADTAICSPSTTSLELAHYGIPFGLVITADNQEKVLEAMLLEHAAISIADARSAPTFQHIETLLTGSERQEIAKRASALVDGQGVHRICEAMGLPDIHFRNARNEDAEDLWHWTNDPSTRAASFNSDPIPWENHIAWYSNQLSSPNVVFLIAESHGKKLGVVRYNLNAEARDESIISIGLAPESRGFGIAPIIISRSAQYFFALHPEQTITAWIKPENNASHLSFIRANYKDYPSTLHPDRLRMCLSNQSS